MKIHPEQGTPLEFQKPESKEKTKTLKESNSLHLKNQKSEWVQIYQQQH